MKRKLLRTCGALAVLVTMSLFGVTACFCLRPEGQFTPAVSSASLVPGLDVRVLSWNVLQSHGRLLGGPWSERKVSFQTLLSGSQYDVICLQEALPEQIAFFSSILPDYSLYAVGRDDGKISGEHCPIFYNTRKYTLRDSGTFWLSPTPEKPSIGWGEKIPRISSWVELEDNVFHKRFRVYNLHMQLHPFAQPKAALVMKEKLKGLNVPTIVMGDFNAPDKWPALKVMESAGFKSADTSSALTYHVHGKGIRCLDHILTDSQWHVASGGVLKEKGGAVYPSDHFGLWAELALR